ncbi:hypothetical protein DFS33DRAFT_1279561 [Desarmillaria ectypa]|nr:hypothetical protein DFS33DRAFT_1279561 [Desarmillaria ectypa]
MIRWPLHWSCWCSRICPILASNLEADFPGLAAPCSIGMRDARSMGGDSEVVGEKGRHRRVPLCRKWGMHRDET